MYNWKNEYSVGVPEMDGHHKKMIELINTLNASISVGQEKSALATILNELESYAKFHFSAEESLLEKYQYPELDRQKVVHEEFSGRIDDFRIDFEGGMGNVGEELHAYLEDWLKKHILEEDQAYANYFKKQGIQIG